MLRLITYQQLYEILFSRVNYDDYKPVEYIQK